MYLHIHHYHSSYHGLFFVVLRTTFVAAYISIISTFAVEIKVLYKTFPLFVRGRTFKFFCVWLEGRL